MRVVVIKIDSATGSGGANVCHYPIANWGAPGNRGENPGVTRGTEGLEAGVRGARAETASEARASGGSMVRWAIADRERVKIGLRRVESGRALRGAILAKANSSEGDGRAQVSQQRCQQGEEPELQLGNSLTELCEGHNRKPGLGTENEM